MKTNPRRRMKQLGLLVALLILAAGILAWKLYTGWERSHLIAIANKHQLVTPATTADCIWQGKIYAWLDENEDGVQDESEIPLSNVTFFVDDTLNGYAKVGKSISNLQGEAFPTVWLAGCPDVELEVYPEVPSDYRLTTPSRATVDRKVIGELFAFGFHYQPGVLTATPRPTQSMSCISYPLVGEQQYCRVENLAISPNGIVWGTTYLDGVFRFEPASHTWTAYTDKDGLPSPVIDSLSIAPNGIVWVTTYNGVASFDGSFWTTHTTRDGSTSTVHDKVVLFAPNGDIWVATTEGAYKIDLDVNRIVSYPIGGDWRTYYIERSTLTPDGTLWGVNRDFVFQLTVSLPNPRWTIYPIPYEYNYYRTLTIKDIAASSNGKLWIVGGSSVLHFDPKTNEWIAYDHSTTNGALLGEGISGFAIAPDNSLWLGTYRNGVIRLVPAADDNASGARIIYYTEKELLESGGISAIAFAPDNAIWFGAERSIVRCILK